MKWKSSLSAGFLFATYCLLVGNANACDTCALYTATDHERDHPGDFQLKVASQFTEFDTLQIDGDEASGSNGENISSSITQVIGRYSVNDKVGISLSLPYIHRSYEQRGEAGLSSGDVSGIGDSTIWADYLAYHEECGDSEIFFRLLAGVKLPTGDSDKLDSHSSATEMPEEETAEHIEDEEMGHDHSAMMAKHEGHHHEVVSGVHGHDLALGSGSLDPVLGASLFARSGQWFGLSSVQYFFRSEGDHDYRYADTLFWSVGPGHYVWLDDDASVALRLDFSGEYKGKDVVSGNKENDTALTAVYVGPQILLTLGNDLSGEMAVELPIFRGNSGTQLVADYRVKANVSYRF